MIKIFVINLERAVDRRKYISSQLSSLQLEYEIHSAVNGINNSHYFDKYYSDFSRKWRYARSLSRSQIGCFASHFELWEKCVKLNEPIIVLEEDVELSVDFANSVNLLQSKLNNLHYVRFMGVFKRETQVVDADLRLYKKGPSGTQGYLITPIGAKKLIANASTWVEPVDDYMDKFWVHGLLPYVVYPEIVFSPHVFDSSVVNKLPAILLFKVTRELYKLSHLIRKNIFIFKQKIIRYL